MKINVRYFASIREWTGIKEETLNLPDGSKVEDLLKEVFHLHENLKDQEDTILVAINGGFVEPSRKLKQGDEVALFPPVSGG